MVEDDRYKAAEAIGQKVLVNKVNEIITANKENTDALLKMVTEQNDKIVQLESKVIAQAALVNQLEKKQIVQPATPVAEAPKVEEKPAETPKTEEKPAEPPAETKTE